MGAGARPPRARSTSACAPAAGHPLLGTGSVHASLIEGGQEYSSYPASCRLVAERRTIPGETDDVVRAEVEALLGDVEGSWQLLIDTAPVRDARRTRRSSSSSHATRAAPRSSVPRGGPTPRCCTQAGIPTVLFGPRGEGAHAVVEWVEIASLERCLDVYVAVAAELCA